jgi:hypothetical protein
MTFALSGSGADHGASSVAGVRATIRSATSTAWHACAAFMR